jgi:hypothetical protein
MMRIFIKVKVMEQMVTIQIVNLVVLGMVSSGLKIIEKDIMNIKDKYIKKIDLMLEKLLISQINKENYWEKNVSGDKIIPINVIIMHLYIVTMM